MGRIVKTFIMTDDTGKTYEKDGTYQEESVQLWAIEISMSALDTNGNYSTYGRKSHIFYVERQTLERLGLVPYFQAKAPVAPRTQEDEIRETLEKLLSLVGVYPAEEV